MVLPGMRFFSLYFAAVVLCAEPVVSNVQISVSHGTVQVVYETSDVNAPANAWIDYGTSPALGYSTPHVRSQVSSNAPTRNVIESGLRPSTQYFFRPVAVGSSGTSNWRCSGDGPGWTCDSNSGLGVFVTQATPPENAHPSLPAGITPINTAMPSIDGETFNVSVDGQKRCQNLQQQINACAAADPSRNHLVVIPAGASCVGRVMLPPKSGSGTCVVRTSTSDSQLPPEGVRIDPSYASRMANMLSPVSDAMQVEGRAVLDTAACNKPVCSEGWRFVGIHFAPEDTRYAKPFNVEIANVSERGVITTVRPHGLETHQQIYISGVEGFDVRGPNGVFRAAVTSPTTLTLLYGYEPPVLTCASPPCHKPGTGLITRAMTSPIAEVSNTSPIILKTPGPHGLPSSPKLPIGMALSTAVTVGTNHNMPANRTVQIEGSSISEWNGVWAVASSTATTVTLRNAPKNPCFSDCGTITRKYTLQVAGVEGNVAANGPHSFTVLSPTEIQLDDASGNGDYTRGGYIALDPDLRFALVRFNKADRAVIDRCFVDGGGFPNRLFYGVVIHSNNSAIVDSYFDEINSWRSIHPATRLVESGLADLFLATSVAVEMSLGSNNKIHNNYLAAQGITLFVQEGSEAVPENLQITRNRFFSDPKFMAGSPVSNGMYYPKRHHLEFKRGRRVLVDGNIIDGNWSDFTPCGPSLALSIRGYGRDRKIVNSTTDFTITNNIFRNTSSAIQIIGADSNSDQVTNPTQRVLVNNNLFHDIDNHVWTSKPSSVGSPGLCGYAIGMLWGIEDLTITNNTAVDIRGFIPQFLSYQYGRSEGVVVRNNVFSHNAENGAGGIPLAASLNLPGMTPPITGTPAQAWSQYFSNSDFASNVVIPGVRNTLSSVNLEITAENVNFSKADCERFYAGFRDITCTDGNSALDRLNSIFQDLGKKNYRLRESTGKGADIDAIERANGSVRPIRAERTSDTEAVITYYASSAEPCATDYTLDPQGDCERIFDQGGEGERTIALLNLQSSSSYFFRLQCQAEQWMGKLDPLTMPALTIP